MCVIQENCGGNFDADIFKRNKKWRFGRNDQEFTRWGVFKLGGGRLKGSQWSTRLEILKSIKDAVHEGELRKGDVLNPYRIHKLTGKDIRIAKEHAPSLVGENVNGKLATLDPDAGPWLLIDDPSDEWLDAKVDGYLQTLNSGSVEVERPPKTDNTEILLAAGGIIAAPILISLLSWAIINHEQIAQQIQEGWDNLCRRWNDFGA